MKSKNPLIEINTAALAILKKEYAKAMRENPISDLTLIEESIDTIERLINNCDYIDWDVLLNMTIAAVIKYLKAPSSIDSYIALIEVNRFKRTLCTENSKLLGLFHPSDKKFKCLTKLVDLKEALDAPKDDLTRYEMEYISRIFEDCKKRLEEPSLAVAHYKYIKSILDCATQLLKGNPKYLFSHLQEINAPLSLDNYTSLSLFNNNIPSKKTAEISHLTSLIKGITMMAAAIILGMCMPSIASVILFTAGERLMEDACQNLGLSVKPVEEYIPQIEMMPLAINNF